MAIHTHNHIDSLKLRPKAKGMAGSMNLQQNRSAHHRCHGRLTFLPGNDPAARSLQNSHPPALAVPRVSRNLKRRPIRQGKVVALIALLMPVLAGFGAFAFDVGYMNLTQSRLQAAAEAAALASVQELPDSDQAIAMAQKLAKFNFANRVENLVSAEDVEFGTWESDGTFQPTSAVLANAVRLTTRRSVANGNRLELFFARILGRESCDISAVSIAIKEPPRAGTRFLIDIDMLNADLPAMQQLAQSLGVEVDQLLTARGLNLGKDFGDSDWTWEDNFLDIPADTILTVPAGDAASGDISDAALFDLDHPDFVFSEGTDFKDFLMYSQTGDDTSLWGFDESYVLDELSPLVGVTPVTDSDTLNALANDDFVHVSPVFPDEIQTMEMDGDVPQVNAAGLRRGLLAFKIMSSEPDANGGDSTSTLLCIKIVDPSTIDEDDVGHIRGGLGGRYRLVR